MQGLVIVAHGSRRAAANQEIQQLTAHIRAQAGARYGVITYGFLEMAEPSIPQAIQASIHAGAAQVTVLPYFLAAGRHVTDDIPQQVQIIQTQYPAIKIQIAPYLGSAPAMSDLLLHIANQTAFPTQEESS